MTSMHTSVATLNYVVVDQLLSLTPCLSTGGWGRGVMAACCARCSWLHASSALVPSLFEPPYSTLTFSRDLSTHVNALLVAAQFALQTL